MQKIAGAGIPETTKTVSSTDTASTLSTLGVTVTKEAPGNTRNAQYALISVETNAIRLGFGDASTSLGMIIYPGEVIKLEDVYEVNNAYIISETAGSHATLQITTEF